MEFDSASNLIDSVTLPNAYLPVQQPDRYVNGEVQQAKALWLAVLDQALTDYQDCVRRAQQGEELSMRYSYLLPRWREIRDWVFSDEMYPFSFRWLTEALGMDPAEVRERLKQHQVRLQRFRVRYHSYKETA